MKKSVGIFVFALAAAGLLAGCNGYSNSTSNPPGTGTACGAPPAVNQLLVLYPKPGTHRAPDNLTAIYIATKGTLAAGNSYDFLLNQSNGIVQYTVNNSGNSGFFVVSASTVPSPHATIPAGDTVYATLLPSPPGPLVATQVFWNDAGTGCIPNVIVSRYTTL